MKVIDPGHHYRLDSLDGEIMQELQFVKRCGENYPGNDEPPYPGATTQEVLRALIDRTKYVDNQIPHPMNAIVLRNLRSALRALETRAADRRDEMIKFLKATCDIERIEEMSTCKTCGHIACTKHPLTEEDVREALAKGREERKLAERTLKRSPRR